MNNQTAAELRALVKEVTDLRRQVIKLTEQTQFDLHVQWFINNLLAQAEEAAKRELICVRMFVDNWLNYAEEQEVVRQLKQNGFEVDRFYLRHGQCGGDSHRVIEIEWK